MAPRSPPAEAQPFTLRQKHRDAASLGVSKTYGRNLRILGGHGHHHGFWGVFEGFLRDFQWIPWGILGIYRGYHGDVYREYNVDF